MIFNAYSALTRNPLLLSRSVNNIFPKHTPLQFRTTPSSSSFPFSNRFPLPFPQLRIRHSRLSTLPHNDSGGTGGRGGSGGWDPGENESDDGGGKWSFLSCISKKKETMNTLASSVLWIFGFCCIVVGGEAILAVPFLLFLFTMVFEGFEEIFNSIFSFSMACIVLATLSFIIQIIQIIIMLASSYALKIGEGATEDDIRSLPMFRFSQPNVMVMVDDNSQSHISELSIHPDDSECCICLCPYVDGTELYRLPCTHHFHCECISRWLRTKAICPLCTLNIRRGDILV